MRSFTLHYRITCLPHLRFCYSTTYKPTPKKYLPSDTRSFIDTLVQIKVTDLSTEEEVRITPDLSESIVELYRSSYQTYGLQCRYRRVNIETTCKPNIFYITGKVPTALFDDIMIKACNPIRNSILFHGKECILYGDEVW
jgi:hypothetical protein